MSMDYDVICLTCDVRHGFEDANHRDDLMRLVVAEARHLKAFAPIARRLAGKYGSRAGFYLEDARYRVDFDWFEKHGDHVLGSINEAGEMDGDCGERFVCCALCESRHTCVLVKGHDGSHNANRPKVEAP